MKEFILSIDQGTTSTTVCLVDITGQIKARHSEEFEQIFPKPGWVEHRPEEIWGTVVNGIKRILEKTNTKPSAIAAIGITNQRETSVLWDAKTSQPIYNAIVWQCRRTTKTCEALKKKGYLKTVKNKTGLVLDPYFSATKINWVLKHIPQAKKKAQAGLLRAGTIDSYLLWKLTSGQSHKTDVSNASRTSLMNIKTGLWDKDLLKIFKVPEKILPQIAPSNGVFGVTQSVPGLPDGIPISGIAGDQQSALFGQTCFKKGEAKCTFGTGSFILMNTGHERVKSKSGVLTTVAWQLKGQKNMTYALEGGAFICGAAVQWLRDGLGIIKKSSEVEALAASVSSTGGVEFVPALSGLGAPYWQPNARGVITGLTRGTGRAEVARATLEAMALQNVDILKAMQKDLGRNMRDLRVDGGASANNLLMQMQADFLGKKIIRPKMIETTVAGAAYLAGLGVGFWSSTSEIKNVWQIDRKFSSQLTASGRSQRTTSWQRAIKKSCDA